MPSMKCYQCGKVKRCEMVNFASQPMTLATFRRHYRKYHGHTVENITFTK